MQQDLRQLRQAYTQGLLLAGRHWRRAADSMIKSYGVSDASAFPLLLIGRLDGEPRQTAIAEAMGIEGPTLVRLLDQLCSAGLVVRREDPLDRRAKALSLTSAGKALVAKIEAELSQLRETVFAEVSAADLRASLRVFQALQDLPLQDPGLRDLPDSKAPPRGAKAPRARQKEPSQ